MQESGGKLHTLTHLTIELGLVSNASGLCINRRRCPLICAIFCGVELRYHIQAKVILSRKFYRCGENETEQSHVLKTEFQLSESLLRSPILFNRSCTSESLVKSISMYSTRVRLF